MKRKRAVKLNLKMKRKFKKMKLEDLQNENPFITPNGKNNHQYKTTQELSYTQ